VEYNRGYTATLNQLYFASKKGVVYIPISPGPLFTQLRGVKGVSINSSNQIRIVDYGYVENTPTKNYLYQLIVPLSYGGIQKKGSIYISKYTLTGVYKGFSRITAFKPSRFQNAASQYQFHSCSYYEP
jgi:hypothetical protein